MEMATENLPPEQTSEKGRVLTVYYHDTDQEQKTK